MSNRQLWYHDCNKKDNNQSDTDNDLLSFVINFYFVFLFVLNYRRYGKPNLIYCIVV